MIRYALILYLVLAFAWCEEALSFSSLSVPTTTILRPDTTNKIRWELNISMIQRRRLQYTRVQMTTDDASSSDNDQTDSSPKKSSSNTPLNKKEVANNDVLPTFSQLDNVIAIVPLLFKFIAVLLIKFLTDLVVFPSLFFYRLARRGKRKIIRAFGRSPFESSVSNVEPNGSAK